MTKKTSYKITAIVSVYKAEEFLRHCLEDLVQQTLFAQTEVLIIDACSPENERDIALEFTEKYPNILYIRTPERETLYASWNRGIRMARGEYITNANADDRHAPHAFQRLAAELDAHPDVALVYAKYHITAQKNVPFDTASIKRHLQWTAHDHNNLLRHAEMGPQPMWRKSLHEKVGFFNAHFTVAGDYDMWLRMSEIAPFCFIPEELGLRLEYDNNLEAQNPQKSYDECYQVKQEALRRFMQPTFIPQPPLPLQFKEVSENLSQLLTRIKQGEKIENLSHVELQFFTYALLTAKMGNVKAALEILTVFFSLITDAVNIAHLYRFLLMTSPKAYAGHLQHELSTEYSRKNTLVSVILFLDEEKYFEETVLSLLAQRERRWHLHIIPCANAANDLQKIEQCLAKYNDPRISISQQKYLHKYAAINAYIQKTSTPFMCLIHAGDTLVPTYLQTACHMLRENAHIGWICPKTLLVGQRNTLAWTQSFDFLQALLQCPCPPATVYRKEMWQELQGYAEHMQHSTLWDFWVRAAEQGWMGLTTAQVEYIYREKFTRLEESAQKIIDEKLEFMENHAWWFVNMPIQEKASRLMATLQDALPQEILHKELVLKVCAAYGNKEVCKQHVAQAKKLSQALQV